MRLSHHQKNFYPPKTSKSLIFHNFYPFFNFTFKINFQLVIDMKSNHARLKCKYKCNAKDK
ncbi:hypothetical protein F5976_04815 [Lacticaseibacillus rhamnosus]|nr:hypothetical protein F5976_04815 [Lacticaseibacillus rhamnosus]